MTLEEFNRVYAKLTEPVLFEYRDEKLAEYPIMTLFEYLEFQCRLGKQLHLEMPCYKHRVAGIPAVTAEEWKEWHLQEARRWDSLFDELDQVKEENIYSWAEREMWSGWYSWKQLCAYQRGDS